MEGLAAAASIVGIVSLGIQLAQILQTQLDDIKDTDERLVQLVTEIKGTAYSISQLRDFLQEEEEKSPDDRILVDEGRAEFIRIIERCHVVYRNCVTLIAKAGTTALAAVDDFERNIKRKDKLKVDYEVTLDIEVSSLQRLMYPLRKSKIERCSADLDRLKLLLILMLSTASLAKSRARSISSTSSATLYASDADQLKESRLVDEVFYTNKSYRTAEKSLAKITASNTSPDPVADTVTKSTTSSISSDPVDDTEAERILSAYRVLQNWPYLGDGTSQIPSTPDLAEQLKIYLSAYAIDFSRSPSRWYQIPSTMRSLHQQALRYSKKDSSLADSFTVLGLTGQKSIYQFLESIAEKRLAVGYPVLLSIQVRKQWLRRIMSILKSFSPYRKIEAFTPTVFVVIGQVREEVPSDSTSGPPIPDSGPPIPNSRPPIPDNGPPISHTLDGSKPRYIKVNRKHLDPETLDAYKLPWEWDYRDSNFIIIKQWIPEPDQDMLFEHTRKLRERKQMLDRTAVLKRERDRLLLTRKRDRLSSPANDPTSIVRRPGDQDLPLNRAMTSAHQRLITDYAHNVVDPDSEEEEPPMEADKITVADYYLGKWTTVLKKVREKNGIEITKEGEENPRKEGEENPRKEGEENPRKEGEENPRKEDKENPSKEDEENPRKEDKENPSKEDEENPRPIRRVTIEEVQEV